MVTTKASAWTVRGMTFLVWLLAAGSAVHWGLKLASGPAPLAAPPAASRSVAVDPAAVARLLGGTPGGGPLAVASAVAAAPQSSRFVLSGIVAAPRSGRGAAVIAVDGKPPRHYRVGSPIDENLVLQSVAGRQAVLAERGSGAVVATLELPPLRK